MSATFLIATSLHKFFCAPLGTGFLYVRRAYIPEVWPLMGAAIEQRGDIRKFDGLGPGTMPIQLRNAVPEAIYFNQRLSIVRKAARLRYLRTRWTSALKRIDGVQLLTRDDDASSCSTVTFVPAKWDVSRFVQTMQNKYAIQVRKRALAGEFSGVRVSVNCFNTADEIDRFVVAATEMLAKDMTP